MRIEAQYQIEQACGREIDDRPPLCYVNVTVWNGEPVAIAANGYVAAVVPVEMEDGDIAGLVHSSVFAYARSLPLSSSGSVYIGLTESAAILSNGWVAARSAHPNYGTMKFPDIDVIAKRERHETQPSFAINPRLLMSAAQAIGCDGGPLVIHRDSNAAPLFVALKYQDGIPQPPFALVMPMRDVSRAA